MVIIKEIPPGKYSDVKNSRLRAKLDTSCALSTEFLASFSGEPAGILLFEQHNGENSPTAFIYQVFVLPEFRGRGIGGTLLSYAEDFAKGQGCASIGLEVKALNSQEDYDLGAVTIDALLVAWYTKNGYSEDKNSVMRKIL